MPRPSTGTPVVPKQWVINPRQFGRSTDAAFKDTTTPGEVIHLRTARLQHYFSVRIRRRLLDEALTVKALADRAELDYQRLTKTLRGEGLLRIEHMAAIESVLPGTFMPEGDQPAAGAN